jgi:hypothetical protein
MACVKWLAYFLKLITLKSQNFNANLWRKPKKFWLFFCVLISFINGQRLFYRIIPESYPHLTPSITSNPNLQPLTRTDQATCAQVDPRECLEKYFHCVNDGIFHFTVFISWKYYHHFTTNIAPRKHSLCTV